MRLLGRLVQVEQLDDKGAGGLERLLA